MTGLLSLTTFSPLLGVAVILAMRLAGKTNDRAFRWIALGSTLLTLALTVVVLAGFDRHASGFQMLEEHRWFGLLNYRMGVDGISVLFVLLTAFLLPLCIAGGWFSIKDRVGDYLIAFLVLECLVIGVFCALDLILFYLFFELQLVPMFLIIGIWGGKNRVYAAFKFFLYTLLGSVLMLAAVLAMIGISGTASIPELMQFHFDPKIQIWLWLAFFASFAVKMPMWPVHTWLPDAHVEAPTAGSVILAGILLKMGGYGFLRFSLPMFPHASDVFTPLIFTLSVIAVVYTSLVAFRQTDIKKLIAYSSVAHMGFVTMGIFAGNQVGVQGAVFQMLSHGFISGALFLCVGVIYDRMHTREIVFYGGLVHRMPWYAAVFMLFTMGNVGLPGTSGFVGEILTMTGTYKVSTWAALVAASGVIFSAVYALSLYRRVVFGEMTNPKLFDIKDLDTREVLIFIPLIAATLLFGIQPNLIMDVTAHSVGDLVTAYQAAIGGRSMLAAHSLVIYIGLYAVAVAVPGPGLIAVIARALGSGFRSTIPTAAGMAVGDWILMTLSALGMAALAKTMGPLFLGVKLAGAAYLLYMAYRFWRAPVDDVVEAPRADHGRAFLSQMALTLGNPKAIAFFVALLPAAIDLKTLTFAGYVELSVVGFILIPAITLTYAAFASRLRGLMANRKSRKAMNRGAAVVMAGAAVGVTVS